jgi:hypothetical protein
MRITSTSVRCGGWPVLPRLPSLRPHHTTRRAGRSFAAPDIDFSVYTDASVSPPPFVGPIAAADVLGKGRGLVATNSLVAGQLLLVTPPLALVEAEIGDIPDHEELLELITASGGAAFSQWHAAWLRSLARGDDAAEAAGSGVAGGGAADLPPLQPPPEQEAWWACPKSGSSGRLVERTPWPELGLTDEQLWGAIGTVPQLLRFPPAKHSLTCRHLAHTQRYTRRHIAHTALHMQTHCTHTHTHTRTHTHTPHTHTRPTVLNCYGEGFQDLPASLAAGAPLSGHVGLWGPFSLLNHSCRCGA